MQNFQLVKKGKILPRNLFIEKVCVFTFAIGHILSLTLPVSSQTSSRENYLLGTIKVAKRPYSINYHVKILTRKKTVDLTFSEKQR